MAQINLPYNLQDGQKAYAARLMANFQALAGLLNNGAGGLDAEAPDGTLTTVQALLDTLAEEVANRYAKAETDALLTAGTKDLVEAVTYSAANGVFTITHKDGSAETIDTALEKVPASMALVEEGNSVYLVITNQDGSKTQTDVSDLLNEYVFQSGATISFSTTKQSDGSTLVTAELKAGSITDAMLDSALISELEAKKEAAAASAIQAAGSATAAAASATAAAQDALSADTDAAAASAAAANASGSASAAAGSKNAAADSATEAAAAATAATSWAVGGTGTRAGEDTNNAKYWAEQASQAAGGGVTSFNGRSGLVIPQTGDYTAAMVGARPDTWTPSAEDVGAQPEISVSGLLKGDGSGNVTAAAAGTDYQAPITANGLLKGDGSGAIAAAAAGTDYFAPGGTDIPIADGGTGASSADAARNNLNAQQKITANGLLKGDGNGNISAAEAGTDFVTPTALTEYIPAAEKDAADGVAGLDGSGKVKPEQASAGIVIVTANRTLSATDNNRCLCCTNTAAITITVSNTQGLPVGAEIEVIQCGTGAVSFAASGVTLFSLDGAVSIAGKYGVAALKQTNTNSWVLCGALA